MLSLHLCIIVVVALLCMTGIVIYALYNGVDGALLSAAVGVIGVIIGAVAKTIQEKRG